MQYYQRKRSNKRKRTQFQQQCKSHKEDGEKKDQVGRVQLDSVDINEDINSKSQEAHLKDLQVKRVKSSDSLEVELRDQVECIQPCVPVSDDQWLIDMLMSNDESWAHILSLQHSNSDNIANFSLKDVDVGLIANNDEKNGDQICSNESNNVKHSRRKRHATWLPAAGTDILPGAEYCPDALQIYLEAGSFKGKSKGNNDNDTVLKVRKHLLCMGWKIEFKQDELETKSSLLYRYTAPDGKTLYSLREASKHSLDVIKMVMNQMSQTHPQGLVTGSDKSLHCNSSQVTSQRKSSTFGAGHVVGESSPCTQTTNLGISEKESPHSVNLVFCAEASHVKTPRDEISRKKKLPGIEPSMFEQNNDLVFSDKESPQPVSDAEVVEPEYCPQAIIDWNEIGSDKDKVKLASQIKDIKLMTLKAKKHLVAVGWRLTYISKSKSRRELRYTSPEGKTYISLVTACKRCIDEGLIYGKTKLKQMSGKDSGKKLKDVHAKEVRRSQVVQNNQPYPHNQVDRLADSCQARVLQSQKRARQILEPTVVHYTPQTIFSCLLDNKIIYPGEKVYYTGKKGQQRVVEGGICREGICCRCCEKVFGLTKFEVHAGGASHEPAANIFLEDGRSLLRCQEQMLQVVNRECCPTESRARIKRKQPCEDNDHICTVCHYGGELVLCEHCPSAFHLSCLGLDDLPKGQWICPSCRCGICGQSEFNGDIEQLTEKTILYCDQCERAYHVGCLRKNRLIKLESIPKGSWFCSHNCEQIFEGLHKLVGKPIAVGDNSYTWTIFRSSKSDYPDVFNKEVTIEHHCKLHVALGVLYECFEPIKEAYTIKDLIKDVLFNKWSKLNRLNFWGFYTVLLEKEDEVISVATIRIYGDKVAELPLIGTRFQYRRRGMCHLLMDVLEKNLSKLGVERLVLPAVPETLHTWTTRFGFSKMTNAERLEFLAYTFLDFQDTIMCQKILRNPPKVLELTGYRTQHQDEIVPNDMIMELVSEENQAQQFEQE